MGLKRVPEGSYTCRGDRFAPGLKNSLGSLGLRWGFTGSRVGFEMVQVLKNGVILLPALADLNVPVGIFWAPGYIEADPDILGFKDLVATTHTPGMNVL